MRKQSGFTLIELLVVIAIIAALVSIAFPVFTSVQERARAAQDMSNLRQIGLATQLYMNDNDGVIFDPNSTSPWMSQLNPKYVGAWKVFQSPFDKRPPSEAGDGTTPVSYGINGNTKSIQTSTGIEGLLSDKIQNSSAFILFAPAQAAGTTVAFKGTAIGAGIGLPKVYKQQSWPSGNPAGGTHNSRTRINAVFGDMHTESMLWSKFILDNDPSDASAAQRWDPYPTYPN